MPIVDKILDYEMGQMNTSDAIKFFQELIDNDMAWTLQGSYGRTATALIEAGHCHRKGEEDGSIPNQDEGPEEEVR